MPSSSVPSRRFQYVDLASPSTIVVQVTRWPCDIHEARITASYPAPSYRSRLSTKGLEYATMHGFTFPPKIFCLASFYWCLPCHMVSKRFYQKLRCASYETETKIFFQNGIRSAVRVFVARDVLHRSRRNSSLGTSRTALRACQSESNRVGRRATITISQQASRSPTRPFLNNMSLIEGMAMDQLPTGGQSARIDGWRALGCLQSGQCSDRLRRPPAKAPRD